MSRPKNKPEPAVDRELLSLLATAEETRLRLDRSTYTNVGRRELAELVSDRVSALEALAQHVGLVSSSDFTKTTKTNPAA